MIVSSGGAADAMTGIGAAVEAYLAASDGTHTFIYYDDDWSTTADREMVARLDNVTSELTVSDFDVY